jgi:Protein of unknown function (DUF3592)
MRRFNPWDLLPLARDLVLLLAGVATGTFAWLRARRAQSWPSTQGTVENVRSRSVGGIYKPWVGEFSYTYVVNGEYFSGFHEIRAFSEKRADALTFGWKSRMLVVRYSPSKYETSVLLRSDQPGGQLGN